MTKKLILFCFLSAVFSRLCFTAPAIAQPTPETVTIGFPSRSMTELPNHIAAVKSFYREEGIDARLIQARSNVLVAALASGSMDYITPVNSSLSGIMSGVPAKVIAIITKNNPDFLMAKPEIRSLKELKGKTLAVSGGRTRGRCFLAGISLSYQDSPEGWGDDRASVPLLAQRDLSHRGASRVGANVVVRPGRNRSLQSRVPRGTI